MTEHAIVDQLRELIRDIRDASSRLEARQPLTGEESMALLEWTQPRESRNS